MIILLNALEIISTKTTKITTNLTDLLEQIGSSPTMEPFTTCSCGTCQNINNKKRSSYSILIQETNELRSRLQKMSIWKENENEETTINNNTTTTANSPFSTLKSSSKNRRSTIFIQSPTFYDAERINYAEKVVNSPELYFKSCQNDNNNKIRRSTMLIFKPNYFQAENINSTDKFTQERPLKTTKSNSCFKTNNNSRSSTLLTSTPEFCYQSEKINYAELIKNFENVSPTTTKTTKLNNGYINNNNKDSSKRSTILISSPDFHYDKQINYAQIKETYKTTQEQVPTTQKQSKTLEQQQKIQNELNKYFLTKNLKDYSASTNSSGYSETPYSSNEISIDFRQEQQQSDDSFKNVTLRRKNSYTKVAEETTLSSLTQKLRSSQSFINDDEEKTNFNKRNYIESEKHQKISLSKSSQKSFKDCKKADDLIKIEFFEYKPDDLNSLDSFETQSLYSLTTTIASIDSNLYNSLNEEEEN